MEAAVAVDAPQPRYRMRDLVDKTGVGREAIRFYIAEGLLPQGHKTSKNMAWYSEEHLQRLHLIRQLQEEHFLPLKAIRTILDEQAEFHFSAAQNQVIASVRRYLRTGKRAANGRAVALSEVLAGHPLDKQDLDEAVHAGLLELDRVADQELIGAEDAELIAAWSELRQAGLSRQRGFSLADLNMLDDVVDILLKQELHLFEERLPDLSEEEGQAVFDRVIPAINRLFGVLHQRRAREFVENFGTGPAGAKEQS